MTAPTAQEYFQYVPMEKSNVEHGEVIYVLRLDQGKFYVGKTRFLEARLEQHSRGAACHWTTLYAFLDVVEQRPVTAMFQEDAVVKEYMVKRGIDNVRGGSYSQEVLSKQQKGTLLQEMRAEADACFSCGKNGHFASACPSRNCTPRKTETCNRCGRKGHSSEQCFASSDVDGRHICDSDDDEADERAEELCWRCGRLGHWAVRCYAKRHISGRIL
jgi:predicted GIY-YIG superfamily endonuclease